MRQLTDSDERKQGMRWEVQIAARPSALEVWEKSCVMELRWKKLRSIRSDSWTLNLGFLYSLKLFLEVSVRIRGIIESAIGGNCWREIEGCGIDNTARVWFRSFIVRFRELLNCPKSSTERAAVNVREPDVIESLPQRIFCVEVLPLLGGCLFIAPIPSLLKESPLEGKRPPFVLAICEGRFRTFDLPIFCRLALRSNSVMKYPTASYIPSVGTFFLLSPDYCSNVSQTYRKGAPFMGVSQTRNESLYSESSHSFMIEELQWRLTRCAATLCIITYVTQLAVLTWEILAITTGFYQPIAINV